MSVVELKPRKEAVVFQVHRAMDDEIRHLFLGQALKRIRAFAEKYDTDADPVIMTREFERDFAKDTNQEFCLVVAIRDLRVIGHFLSRAEFYYGKKYVYVVQLDILDAGLIHEEVLSGMSILKDWARSVGALGIRAGALTRAHERLYRKYGLTPFASAMLKGDL